MMTQQTNQVVAQKIVQQKINYQFKNNKLLTQALTHRSYSSQNYERLEFIGDSILNYTIAKMLCDTFPDFHEGKLSLLRSQLVKEATLAEIARELKLGDALLLGSGELKSGGSNRASILADALEAIFAAVSLDADFATANKLIFEIFINRINKLDINTTAKDSKTQLQEFLQSHKLALPKYRIDKQTGEGNHARFDVSCDLGDLGKVFCANAHSRRAAEQECAKQALAWLHTQFK